MKFDLATPLELPLGYAASAASWARLASATRPAHACTWLRVVDWAWSRASVPWLDAGFLLLRLIEAGHSPAEAEQWAANTEAWVAAAEDDRTAFAVAVLGIWEFLQRDQPLPHRERLTDAARRWAKHRLS